MFSRILLRILFDKEQREVIRECLRYPCNIVKNTDEYDKELQKSLLHDFFYYVDRKIIKK